MSLSLNVGTSILETGFSPGPASKPGPNHSIDVCVCVSVPPEEAWTFSYLFDTFDLLVPFGYL